MRIRLIESPCGLFMVQVWGPEGAWVTGNTFTDFRTATDHYKVLQEFHGANITVLHESTT